ncbi:hypothetical protein RRSWK_00795 [Rhodopirellula sp. SWK7]|nr:hypothetical protein RRSWK_00795 [Rhodopirellula sp. SWK7]
MLKMQVVHVVSHRVVEVLNRAFGGEASIECGLCDGGVGCG